ncbi:MAG: hypothetical protein U1A78_31320 [Polyangia bacterium]
MPPFVLNLEIQSTESAYDECFFSLTMTRILPEGAKYAATFEALCADGLKVLEEQRKLEEAALLAQAQIQAADLLLNRFVDRLLGVLAGLGEGRSGSPAYDLFFGGRAPSSLKKFVLGEQLEIMRGWLAKLDAAAPVLKALAPDLKKLIEGGDAAKAGLVDARAKIQAFRQTGSRKGYFDKVNSARKSAYGELSKLPFDKPELHLGADFGDRFFRPGPRSDVPAGDEALLAARSDIAELERALGERKKELVSLEAEAQARAQEAAARAEKEKRLAEIAAQSETLAREQAELTRELGPRRGRRKR